MSTNMREKLGGLSNTAESLGRFLGPVGYSITYAWSVSASTLQAHGGWVDCRFVFYASAAVLAVVARLAWDTLILENLMKPELDMVLVLLLREVTGMWAVRQRSSPGFCRRPVLPSTTIGGSGLEWVAMKTVACGKRRLNRRLWRVDYSSPLDLVLGAVVETQREQNTLEP